METETLQYVRPGFVMTHIANPINRRLGLFPTLTVQGRKTGEPHTIPIGKPFVFSGARYLVSGRGETQWARNLRAVGQGEMRFHGRTEHFRAVEVVGPERERIVTAYRESLGHSVDGYFRQIPDPADHPVFLMEADA